MLSPTFEGQLLLNSKIGVKFPKWRKLSCWWRTSWPTTWPPRTTTWTTRSSKRTPKCSIRNKKGRNDNFDKNTKKIEKACFRNASKQVWLTTTTNLFLKSALGRQARPAQSHAFAHQTTFFENDRPEVGLQRRRRRPDRLGARHQGSHFRQGHFEVPHTYIGRLIKKY